jgi:predicted DNA-binding transcriptional regulator AlpA
MNSQTTPPSPVMKPAEAASILGVTVKQLDAMRRQNAAPKFYVLGPRLVRFDRADVERRLAT